MIHGLNSPIVEGYPQDFVAYGVRLSQQIRMQRVSMGQNIVVDDTYICVVALLLLGLQCP